MGEGFKFIARQLTEPTDLASKLLFFPNGNKISLYCYDGAEISGNIPSGERFETTFPVGWWLT